MAAEVVFDDHIVIPDQIIINRGFVLEVYIEGTHCGFGKFAYIGDGSVIKSVFVE
jgi:hypothetical protein